MDLEFDDVGDFCRVIDFDIDDALNVLVQETVDREKDIDPESIPENVKLVEYVEEELSDTVTEADTVDRVRDKEDDTVSPLEEDHVVVRVEDCELDSVCLVECECVGVQEIELSDIDDDIEIVDEPLVLSDLKSVLEIELEEEAVVNESDSEEDSVKLNVLDGEGV